MLVTALETVCVSRVSAEGISASQGHFGQSWRSATEAITEAWNSIRGVFDEQTRRKPLVFAADAVRYGI
jgi:hypothetical protein